jgi:hypothetical protein
MKVRWTTGSVRFRISPTELEELAGGKTVRVELAAPGGRWEAALVPGAAETEIALRGIVVYVSLSDADVARLAAPDTEGIYFDTDGEPALHYFIEKDFPCVHPRADEARECAEETFSAPERFAERHRRSKPAR